MALNFVLGENGILKHAGDAKLKYQIAQAKEELDLKIAELQAEKQGTATLNDLIDILKNETDMDYIVSLTPIASITGVEETGEAKEIYVIYKIYQFRVDEKLKTEFISIVENYAEEESNLVAWYDGIRNTNDGHSYNTTTWIDLTGNNVAGATINGTTWTPNGLLFNGSTNNWVNMNTILMPEEDNFTLDIIFSLNAYTSGQYFILSQIDMSNLTNRTGLCYGDSKLLLQNIGASSTDLCYDYNPKITEKVNMTIVRNGDTLELWANGEKVDEQTTPGLKISQINATLGKWGTNYYFNGIIYSLRTYNRNLSSEEIIQNYNIDKIRFAM